MPLHVYGVTRADVVLPDGLAGALRRPRDDRRGRRAGSAGLRVPRGADRAGAPSCMAHARVLEQVVETETVLPMQFGMCMPDDQTVRHDLLVAHRPRLATLLDRARRHGAAHRQGGLPRGRRAARGAAPLTAAAPDARELASIPADAAHFKQAEFGQAGRRRARADGQPGRLGDPRRAGATVRSRHAEGEHLSPYHILNTAFLVRREARARFDEAVGADRRAVERGRHRPLPRPAAAVQLRGPRGR